MRNVILRLFGIRVIARGHIIEVHLPRWLLWVKPTFAVDVIKRLTG